MLVTLLPIVTEVKFLQLLNADSPILSTLSGIMIEVKFLQFSNAPNSIVVILFGSIILEIYNLQRYIV